MATTKVQSSKSPTDLGQLLYIRKKQKQKMNQSGAEERCRKRKYLIHSTEKSKINGVPRVMRSTASINSSSISTTSQLTPCQSHSCAIDNHRTPRTWLYCNDPFSSKAMGIWKVHAEGSDPASSSTMLGGLQDTHGQKPLLECA